MSIDKPLENRRGLALAELFINEEQNLLHRLKFSMQSILKLNGVAKGLRCSVFQSCEVYSRRFESRRWNHKPPVNSAVHPSGVSK